MRADAGERAVRGRRARRIMGVPFTLEAMASMLRAWVRGAGRRRRGRVLDRLGVDLVAACVDRGEVELGMLVRAAFAARAQGRHVEVLHEVLGLRAVRECLIGGEAAAEPAAVTEGGGA